VDGTIRIEIDGAVLKTAIDQVVFAAAPDDTRPVLAGVLLRLDTGQLTLTAADGFRLAIRTLSLTDTTTRAAWIVPARTLVEVAHSLPSTPGMPVALSGTAGDHQLHVALGGFPGEEIAHGGLSIGRDGEHKSQLGGLTFVRHERG